MKLTEIVRGKHFGELGVYHRGIITCKVSPFELRAFAGFQKSIPRTIYRIASNVPYMLPPFLMAYMIFTSTEQKFEQMCRKNPEDYVNEK